MSRVRAAVGVLGELLVTAGAVLLLFAFWQLVVVGMVDTRAQNEAVAALEREFSAGAAGEEPPGALGPEGSAVAILRVPRLGGPTWARPVYEGVGLGVLAKGLGRYPTTQQPGQLGNTAIAGHRAGHGNPLLDIDAIRPGDVLVVETREQYAVYRAERSLVVRPTRVDVLAPVPGAPGATPRQAYLTLTSCDPRYGSTNRYVVHALLDRAVPRAAGLPGGLLADPNGLS